MGYIEGSSYTPLYHASLFVSILLHYETQYFDFFWLFSFGIFHVSTPYALSALYPDDEDEPVKKEQVVDPWTVESEGAIDYNKLIQQFG